MLVNYKTRLIFFLILLPCFVFVSGTSAQRLAARQLLEQTQLTFENGNFRAAIEQARKVVGSAENPRTEVLTGLEIIASSQISLQASDQARETLDTELRLLPDRAADPLRAARIYLLFAWLERSRHRFSEALNYSKKAVDLAPGNGLVRAEHYLNLGRILFASGFDISAIVWLEKADNLLKTQPMNAATLDTYRFLSLAWWAKLNYQKALGYAEKAATEAANTRYKYKYRQALFDWATILSETGQKTAALLTLGKGLKLAVADDNSYQACIFLTSLLLNSLDNDRVSKASAYLHELQERDRDGQFSFEIILGKAIILASNGEIERSEELFARLEKMENSSDFILPGWRLKIAKNQENWNRMVQLNQKYLELTLRDNFRDELPSIHFDFAQAYFHLNQGKRSLDHLGKALALIEEIRRSESTGLSLGILETYHSAYRLLTQIKLERPDEAFETADFLKGRLLKDRINGAGTSGQFEIMPAARKRLKDLSLKYVSDPSLATEIEETERFVTNRIPELTLPKPDLSKLGEMPDLDDAAIISYVFTLDKRLLAFVWEKKRPLRVVYLPVSERQVEIDAGNAVHRLKNHIFFKTDGEKLYDKLLKPLEISSRRLIVVPDKFLWKIPFQALSPDAKKYLIEDKLISYAPSVSVLLDQLKKPKSNRSVLRAFANPVYSNRYLSHVNSEAAYIASLYNSKPILNSTTDEFRRLSDQADILHFSMHAQIDEEWPLRSFLAFREIGDSKGRLTVEDILSSRLRKGSFVFLASCDTNNVTNGEGLVSLAWGMMGAGATTVMSAQMEANDRSTETFTRRFYKQYKNGMSAAEAIQQASIAMIQDKSSEMHEPYYWAPFVLLGDFR